MSTQTVQPGTRPAQTRRRPAARSERIILRTFPKVIFLYPTFLAAVVATVGAHWWTAHPTVWGMIFLVVASLNLVVISFDFPRATSLSLFFVLVIVVLGALLLNRWVDVLPRLEHLTGQLAPHANAQFYGWLAVVLFCLILVAFLIHRHLDYWELMP